MKEFDEENDDIGEDGERSEQENLLPDFKGLEKNEDPTEYEKLYNETKQLEGKVSDDELKQAKRFCLINWLAKLRTKYDEDTTTFHQYIHCLAQPKKDRK